MLVLAYILKYDQAGFWVALAGTAIAAVLAVMLVYPMLRYIFWPWNGRYCTGPFGKDVGRHLTKSRKIREGRPETLLMRVEPSEKVILNEADLRLVQRRFWPKSFRNVPKEVACITSLKDLSKNAVCTPSLDGSYWGITWKSPETINRKDYIWFEVEILGHQKWKGRLSFQGALHESKSRFTRLSLEVM